MNQPLPGPIATASRLRAAIEETAAALAGADLERLLASDALLRKAVGDVSRGADLLAPDERAQLRDEIDAAQAALRRCRRLGASLNDFARFTLDAQGAGLDYQPARAAAAAMTGRGFNERA